MRSALGVRGQSERRLRPMSRRGARGGGAWLAALALGALAVAAAAQSTSVVQISGRVLDPSGAAVVNARVTATQISTGQRIEAVTGPGGAYQLLNLPVGAYSLTVRAGGFSTYVQNGIVLQVGTNPVINITLRVGGVNQEVEVTANSAMVETHDNSVSQVIDERRILALPLNGRNAANLVLLAGASAPQNGSGDINSSKNFNYESQTMSVAGGQGNGTNFLLDGADNNDHFTNVNLPFPFPDALQEFSVQTSDLSAKYGEHPGGVVNIVTRSGGNRFHGDLFEFVRNYRFNAAPAIVNYQGQAAAFVKGRDSLKRNQFGGTFGGPIVRNKLFFFGGFQGTILKSNPPTKSTHVATAAVLAGDWTAMESAACNGGKAKTLSAPFAANTINPSAYNSAALAMIKLVPVSTDPCGLLYYSIPGNQTEQQYVGRVDYIHSSKQTMFGRYLLVPYSLPPTYAGNLLTTTQAGQDIRSQSAAFGDNYVLSPNVVNTFHLTGTRLRINRGGAATVPNPTQFGVQIHSLVPDFLDFSISHYFSAGCGTCSPGHFNTNGVQLADDLTWVKGAHQLALGADWIRSQTNELSNFKSNGQFSFDGKSTGNELADFLMGLPSDFTQGMAEQENWRDNYLGLYAEDNWRASSRLTLNAGLRWDPYFPAIDRFHRGNHFDPAAFAAGQFSSIYVNAPAGMFFYGDPQTPPAFTSRHLADFAPRLGAIWDPAGNGRMTIRAGYGLFYDYPEEFYFDRFADDAPFGSSIDIPRPTGGLSDPYQSYPGGDPFPLPFPPTRDIFFPPFGVYINLPLHIQPTYVQQWNLTWQRQFGANWLAEISYLGNRTNHLWLQGETNPAVWLTAAQCAGAGITLKNCDKTSNENNQRVLYLQNPAPRFGQAYSSLAMADDGGVANYNGLLLSLNHRFSRNFTLLSNYTWSHCLDTTDFGGEVAGQTYQNPYNRNADYGSCGFDLRHVFNTSLVAAVPAIGSGWLRAALEDWQFSTILTIHSGTPFSVTSGKDYASSSTGGQRANLIGDPTVANPSALGWFNTAAFACNGYATYPDGSADCATHAGPDGFGDSGRNFLYGPGNWNVDSGLSRFFQVREGQRLELRAEAFNLFNHANLNNPQSALTDKQFGQITSASGPRIMQFALKFEF